MHTHTHIHAHLQIHAPPLTGHQAAKWGVKYNFHARQRHHSLNTSFAAPLCLCTVSVFDTPSAPPLKGTTFTQKRELSRHQDCSDLCLWVVRCSRPLGKSTKGSLPRQAQAGRGPPSCSSDSSQAWRGVPGEEILHAPTPTYTAQEPGYNCGYRQHPWVPVRPPAGPLLVTGEGWWSQPLGEAWAEAPGHPAPLPQPSRTQLCWASTSGNRNLSLKRVIFIRQQLCLQNTFPYVCFQPGREWVKELLTPICSWRNVAHI